jgi:hypothetical protein
VHKKMRDSPRREHREHQSDPHTRVVHRR